MAADKQVSVKVVTEKDLAGVQAIEDKVNQLKQQKLQLQIDANTSRLDEVNSKINEAKNKLATLQGKADVDDSELKKVLDEIFTVDPVSGLPQGDYQYYMSPSGNPVVKQWLENNLLRPRMSSGGSSVEGVTDDMIFEMSRKSGESVSDYQSRLTSLYDSAKAEYEKYLSEIKSE